MTIEYTIRSLISSLNIVDATRLRVNADLFDAGMTSHASVKLMLALEDAFDLEFPDEMLQREFFSSIRQISSCISKIAGQEC